MAPPSAADTAENPGGDWLAEALAPYVSPLVLEHVAKVATALEPHLSSFQGVVLFTDIAGFTTLTEQMERAGPVGVETLSRLLNAYFTDIIGLVEAHGGLVLKFAGDALIAVWKTGGIPLTETAHRAAQCTALLQQQMSEFHATNEVTLTMRASLAAGEVRHMILGSAAAGWVSRLGGKAMTAARAALADAHPGDAVLDFETAQLLGSRVNAARQNGSHRLVSTNPISIQAVEHPWVRTGDPSALFSHVPRTVRERITAGQAHWIAEFRRLTVLFIHVPDFDDGHSAALGHAQSFMRVIQAALERYGGAMDDLGDDLAGFTFIGALGVPTFAYEDDAVRAVRIALEVRRGLRDLGFSSAIGVATSRLFCGAIGSQRRRTYSMVGDGMNRCARLMRLAEGDVFCDETTWRAASRSIGFEYLRHVALRGKTGTVALYRPLEQQVVSAPPNRAIVGRQSERGLIRQRLEALQNTGAGGVLIIEGEAGIGKSTLLTALKKDARELGLRLLAGGGDSLERTNSYYAWQRIFAAALGFVSDADFAERSEILLDVLAAIEGAIPLAPLLNPALGLHLAENEMTAQMTAQSRAEAASTLLVRLLMRTVGDAPFVAVLEDAHWLDSASWGLALELHRKIPRLLLVLATRPLGAPAPEVWETLRDAAGEWRMLLGPMCGNDVLELVCRRLKVDALPTEAAELIVEKAEGHPFFSEELAYALRDAGHLVIQERVCKLAPGTHDFRRLNFPANVQGVVSERIDRLSPQERMAIKVASVNGRAFSLRILQAIHPPQFNADHLPACLARLVDLDLAVCAQPGENASYLFKHNIIQEVAYEQLLFSQRQELHARLAAFIEQNDGENFPILAHHWRSAGATGKAIHYLDRAGDVALQRYANREAIEFLEQAISLSAAHHPAPAALDFGRWHRQIGEAYYRLGRIALSRERLSQATRIFGFPMASERRIKTTALPAAIGRQVFHRARRPAKQRNETMRSPLFEALHTYNLLAEIAFFTNDLITSVFCNIHALNLAETAGPSPKLTELYGSMMLTAAALPLPALGTAYFDLAASAAADEATPPLTRAYVQLLMGMYRCGLAQGEEGRALIETAGATFRQFGNSRRNEECLTNQLYSLVHHGALRECAGALAQLVESSQRRGDQQSSGWAKLLQAEVALPMQGPAAALAALGEDEAMAGDNLTWLAFHALRAAALFRAGDFDAAQTHAERVLQPMKKALPVSHTMMLYPSYLAEVFLGLFARAKRAGASTRQLAAQARVACSAADALARSFPIGRPRAHLWRGIEHWLHDRPNAAEARWQRARELAERCQIKCDLARAHSLLALIGGEPHRSPAAALFAEIGALSELAYWPVVH